MKDAIKNLSERIAKTSGMVLTEEATKNAYIMPFLQVMGYDVFNPLEVVPEFTADVGLKEGEKVDYAIVLNGTPVMLIECKCCNNELNAANESQLLRYFHTTQAKFGILTNGIVYNFYSDLAEPNKMDLVPFLSIDLSGDLDKINYAELSKFKKEVFDAENIRRTAEILKCSGALRKALAAEFAAPSEEFVRLLFKKINPSGIFNNNQKEKLTPLVKAALDTLINEKVKASLDAALKTTADAQEITESVHETVIGADTGIVTTQEEIDGCNIIKAIAAEATDPARVVMRDAKSYCAILFDDNNRKPLVRLFFNNPTKLAVVFFDGPQEEKVFFEKVSDLYQHKDRILNTIKKYTVEDANA